MWPFDLLVPNVPGLEPPGEVKVGERWSSLVSRDSELSQALIQNHYLIPSGHVSSRNKRIRD